jgi:tol-pal system protein YbgF
MESRAVSLPAILNLPRVLAAVVAIALLVPGAAFAQSRTEAQLQLQIQELQEQIRLLTGQVEGLQFQLTQMQTLIERVGKDNEFRFQQLEGNAGVTAPEATDMGALTSTPAAPAPAAPEDPTTTAELADPAPLDLETGTEMGESADPLVGSNSTGAAPLGTLGGEDLTLGGNRPLDLSLGSTAAISNGDAQAQYEAGYEAIVRGDYAFAEDQFSQFVSLYPDDPNAPDATNWLGEALIQRGAYDDAALVLAEGYQKYQQTERAPDLMLKLGIALLGAGEVDVACRTFFTLERRYPNMSPAFQERLADEKTRAQCPV